MKKMLVAALILPVALLGAARPAKANDTAAAVFAGVAAGVGAALILNTLGHPVVAAPEPVYPPPPPPVMYPPAPVVYAPPPPPVVYQPAPVVYQPAPVIVTPPPVVYRSAPVVVTRPAVVHRAAPVVVRKGPQHGIYPPNAVHPVYGYDRAGRVYWGDRYIPDR
jgi:hypothetical protein